MASSSFVLTWIVLVLQQTSFSNTQHLTNVLDSQVVSEMCRRDMSLFIRRLNNVDGNNDSVTWAHFMLDSYGSVPSGVLIGAHVWEGDYFECLDTVITYENSTEVPGSVAQYCLVFVATDTTLLKYQPLQIGTCSPSSCSTQDLQIIYNSYISKPYIVAMDENFCQTREAKQMDATTVGICGIIAILLTLVVTASMLEVADRLLDVDSSVKPSTWKNALLSFSAITNCERIVCNLGKSQGDLSVIYGLRALSMFWVIVGHTGYILKLSILWKNGNMIPDLLNKFSAGPFVASEFSVDTFLFINGFLIVRGLKSKLESEKRFNYFMYIIHRLIRTLPTYLFLLAVLSGPLPHLPKGPISPALFVDRDVCRRTWWKHALFIQNYFNDDDDGMCMPQTWYMCLDFAFYAIYPIIIYPLYKKPVLGYILFGLFFIASFLVPGTLIYVGDLDPMYRLRANMDLRTAFNHQIYSKPWGRMGAGLVGLAFGHIYSVWTPKRKQFNSVLVGLLWVLCGIVSFALIYGPFPFVTRRKELDIFVKVMFGTFSRPTWCFVVGFVTVACTADYGSYIDKILSWKGFIIVNRLSYCMYLVHYAVLSFYLGNLKNPLYMDDLLLTYVIILIIALSAVAAFFVNLVVEQPFMRLEKVLFIS